MQMTYFNIGRDWSHQYIMNANLCWTICLCQVLATPWSPTVCLWLTVWCCTMDSTRKWWWAAVTLRRDGVAVTDSEPADASLAEIPSARSFSSKWETLKSVLLFFLFLIRCSSHTKHLSTTCVGSTLKTTSTSYRRSAPITCRASPRASTHSMLEMTGEYYCYSSKRFVL